jgi:glutathione S-transferase
MITLWHCAGTRSFRALWALEEIGIDYELRPMAFPPRAREPGYLEINPMGTVPTFLDGDTLMTESAAICEYLAARYGPSFAVGPEQPGFSAYLNFLHMSDATLTFPQTLVLRYTRLEPPERRLPQAAADYAQWFHSRLRGAMKLMGSEDFAAAGRFTVADIAVAYALRLADTLGLSERFPDPARAYYERMQARAGYQRALAREAEGPSALATSA